MQPQTPVNHNTGYCVMRNQLTLVTEDPGFSGLKQETRKWIKQVLGDFTVTGIPGADREAATAYLDEHHIQAAAA